jgi:hypothetical protein
MWLEHYAKASMYVFRRRTRRVRKPVNAFLRIPLGSMGCEMDLPELVRMDLFTARKVAVIKAEMRGVGPTQSEKPCCVHPLISGKRLNRRKALHLIQRFPACVVGKTAREVDDPLNYRHRPADTAKLRMLWSVGASDIAVWGEGTINHRRVTNNFQQHRIIVRAKAYRKRPAESAVRKPSKGRLECRRDIN